MSIKNDSDSVVIGRILKPQGICGEVKADISLQGAYLHTLKTVYLGGSEGGTAADVESVSVRGGFAYFHFAGADTREAAEALRNKAIAVPRSIVRLKKGEYLHSDLIGCTLRDETGKIYGTVEAIDSYGAADVYTVRPFQSDAVRTDIVRAENGVFRFPFIKKLNAKADVAAKTLTVDAAALEEIAVYD
ncbi:hypothetical protein FACS1894211_10440 [Clostridia bacterium]|nr:hypothetical protein FACS1894211_10440 [Clostridia bacterium]